MIEVVGMFEEISDRLAAMVPELRWIDEDRGQLESIVGQESNEYGINYPSVFISTENVDWYEVGNGKQRGKAVIRIKIALEQYTDTYQTSPQRQASLQNRNLISKIYQSLEHFTGTSFDALIRTNSRKEPDMHPLYVYSMAFTCEVVDTSFYNGPTQEVAADLTVTKQPRGPRASGSDPLNRPGSRIESSYIIG